MSAFAAATSNITALHARGYFARKRKDARNMLPSIPLVLTVLVATAVLGLGAARALVIAQPDEWLLCIRNGKLVKAGVGISLWRRPGDVVARFTSTMQRVGFAVDALSNERLSVSIQGFILWSVSAEGDGPFQAFRKLGLVNLDAPPLDLRSPKHLLSTPQHRAFQQLLGAAVQRLAATRSLEDLLLGQDTLVTELHGHLATLEREMGIRIDQIELLQVRPADAELLRHMSAKVEERVREEASNVHLETIERT
jgi:flotillin